MENTVKITAAEVNILRQATGAGMMDCKKALVEASGDFDKAIAILRKKGQKVAGKELIETLLKVPQSQKLMQIIQVVLQSYLVVKLISLEKTKTL